MDALETENAREQQPQVAVYAEDAGENADLTGDTEHRELTLMFTDIVGYSRLMGHDETLAVAMLSDYRQILLAHIAEHGGVFIEFAGDAVLARFDTAAAAVAAAVAIQKHLQLFNQGREGELPRLQTRIGLHRGQILLRDNAVFGDDVNIAARLETLAVADGICISKAVYDEVRLTLQEPVKPLGLQPLKNIGHKVRTYLIKPTGFRWRDHLHYFLLRRQQNLIAYRHPIAVAIVLLVAAGFYFIPRWLVPGYTANYVEVPNFQNLMNAEGKADYFSSGITEAVRSQLADMRDVYIVDPAKGTRAPIRLEGSVQRLGDNMRISYRIFRRDGSVQIAGGKLDGAYQDIFILQDRLVGQIAGYLAKEFQLQNFRPAPLKLTDNVTAYDYYLQGQDILDQPLTQDNIDRAIQLFNSALVHDPHFALANTGICDAYGKKYLLTDTVTWLNDAERYCLLALSQEETSVVTYRSMGSIYLGTGRYRQAIASLVKGRALNKYDVGTAAILAQVYDQLGEKQQAEALLQETVLLLPKNAMAYESLGYFLLRNGRHQEAISTYQKALELTPYNVAALNNLGVSYAYAGRFDDAAKSFEKAANLEPRSGVFANAGGMYYYARQYQKAAASYEQALRLEPTSYRWMVHLADTYKFMRENRQLADDYFRLSIATTRKVINENPGVADSYQFLAIALASSGQLDEAKITLNVADKLDDSSTDANYAHLRVAVLESDDGQIRYYARRLLAAEYSAKLLLVDPDFAVLTGAGFKDLFAQAK